MAESLLTITGSQAELAALHARLFPREQWPPDSARRNDRVLLLVWASMPLLRLHLDELSGAGEERRSAARRLKRWIEAGENSGKPESGPARVIREQVELWQLEVATFGEPPSEVVATLAHFFPALEFDLCSFVNPIFEPQAERYVSYQRFCGGALVHAQQGSLPDASGEKLLRRRWPERHRLYTERA